MRNYLDTITRLENESIFIQTLYNDQKYGVLLKDNIERKPVRDLNNEENRRIEKREAPIDNKTVPIVRRTSANDDSSERLFQSAVMLLKNDHDEEAKACGRSQLLFLTNEKHYAPAILFLARIEEREHHERAALALYQKAADLGDAQGQYEAAKFLLNTSNDVKNLALAFSYCEKAANQGMSEALSLMGDFYQNSDPEKAEDYYRRAKEAKD
ncbi:MAG: sel1 repeat family protein [Paludibacteraceae bacterium]|nr:sel1 repeat family protein [Paludibacteraceae bacterium]